MNLIPKSIRTLLARKKPAPRPLCTDENVADLRGVPVDHVCGGAIPMERNKPETVRETWFNDSLPDVARRW